MSGALDGCKVCGGKGTFPFIPIDPPSTGDYEMVCPCVAAVIEGRKQMLEEVIRGLCHVWISSMMGQCYYWKDQVDEMVAYLRVRP